MAIPVVFAAALDGEVLTIDIFDAIGSDFFGEGVTATSVAEAIRDAPDATEIKVRINSPGGSVFEGNTIFNLLKRAKATVKVEIQGLAASMASVIALAGDTVEIAENALFMIHEPFSFAIGDAETMRKEAAKLEKIRGTISKVYQANSNLNADEIDEMMRAETWLSADETVEAGFADNVIGDDGDAVAAGVHERFFSVVKRFQSVPTAFATATRQVSRVAKPKQETKTMDPKILKALGLDPGASADDVVKAIAKSNEERDAAVALVDENKPSLNEFVPRADYDLLKTEVTEIKAQTAAAAKATHDAEVDAEVTAAIQAGKVSPSQRDYHVKCCETPEGLQRFREYILTQPAIVRSSTTLPGRPTGEGNPQLSAEELLVCHKMGLEPEAFIKARVRA